LVSADQAGVAGSIDGEGPEGNWEPIVRDRPLHGIAAALADPGHELRDVEVTADATFPLELGSRPPVAERLEEITGPDGTSGWY
jgi:uncharacterized protein YbjT (DUF2867 family)